MPVADWFIATTQKREGVRVRDLPGFPEKAEQVPRWVDQLGFLGRYGQTLGDGTDLLFCPPRIPSPPRADMASLCWACGAIWQFHFLVMRMLSHLPATKPWDQTHAVPFSCSSVLM